MKSPPTGALMRSLSDPASGMRSESVSRVSTSSARSSSIVLIGSGVCQLVRAKAVRHRPQRGKLSPWQPRKLEWVSGERFQLFGRLNSDGQSLGGGVELNGNGGFRKTLQELLGVCLAAHDREPQPCPPGEIGRSFKLEQVSPALTLTHLVEITSADSKLASAKPDTGESSETRTVSPALRFVFRAWREALPSAACRRQNQPIGRRQSVRDYEELFAGFIGRTNKPIAGLAREQFDPSNALIIRGDVNRLPNFRGFIVRIGKAPRAVFTQE